MAAGTYTVPMSQHGPNTLLLWGVRLTTCKRSCSNTREFLEFVWQSLELMICMWKDTGYSNNCVVNRANTRAKCHLVKLSKANVPIHRSMHVKLAPAKARVLFDKNRDDKAKLELSDPKAHKQNTTPCWWKIIQTDKKQRDTGHFTTMTARQPTNKQCLDIAERIFLTTPSPRIIAGVSPRT